MFAPLARGAQAARGFVAPVSFFSVGYGCHWSQSREETVPQLLACATAASWSGFAFGARQLRTALQNTGADWPLKQLAKIEAAEIRVLATFINTCSDQGLDSPCLRRIALRSMASVSNTNPRGLGIIGLVPISDSDVDGETAGAHDAPGTGSVADLAALIDDTASALASVSADYASAVEERSMALPALASALLALTVTHAHDGAASPTCLDELGADGVVRAAHAATLAASWLAAQRRQTSREAAKSSFNRSQTKVEEEQQPPQQQPPQQQQQQQLLQDEFGLDALCGVWKALGEPGVAALLAARPASSMAAAQQKELAYQLKVIREMPAAPEEGKPLPALAFLPEELQGCVAAISSPQGGRHFRSSAAKADRKGGFFVSKFFEYAAWTVIAIGTLVAVSQDGLGICGFHALPREWNGALLRRAVLVEELLAKYEEPSKETAAGFISLGPTSASVVDSHGGVRARANYLQGNAVDRSTSLSCAPETVGTESF
eukprot:TRINITY_DN4237_c0_g2_i1.p1 TRINITY_DN4237_c0_g2~~TRINITY_DN4237_c0_g2_i1.p1  ORF type:complete len:491 (+),score=94.48 TRINITY_DN4237_c0_g2_i1:86-1558(+)